MSILTDKSEQGSEAAGGKHQIIITTKLNQWSHPAGTANISYDKIPKSEIAKQLNNYSSGKKNGKQLSVQQLQRYE